MSAKSKIPSRMPRKRLLGEIDLNSAICEEPPKKLPSRTQLRRSKSVSSLAEVGRETVAKKIFAVPKVPPKKPVQFSTVTRTALSRRSKSFSDLRGATAKKPEVKKPAPVAAAPAAAKVTKPKPYDYKARFNLLLEKHQKLVETEKGWKKRCQELENVLADLENYKKASAERDLLEEKNRQLQEDLTTSESKFVQSQKEVNRLTVQCENLSREIRKLTNENDNIKKEVRNLSDSYEHEKQRSHELQVLNSRLQDELKEHEDLRRQLHNSLQDLKGTIRVHCRVRPMLEGESDKPACNMDFLDETSFEMRKMNDSNNSTKCRFTFDKVFTPCASQEDVFEDLAALIQSAVDGYNVCVFSYGQTGSGKTYTMQGEDTPEGLGMIPRSIELIFRRIASMALTGWKYEVSASFVEIYNERINDLLNPGSNEEYKIYYNEGKGTTVTNLKTVPISSAEELLETMKVAHNNRVVACTNFNEHSSRSHAVVKIMLKGRKKNSDVEYLGSVSLVDLAGSENAKTSERMTETKSINKSLSALGSVILALYNKDPHIPYRNSKLTYLLQSSLAGNSKTLMFVHLSPLDQCYAESISSLRFASTVKDVKISSKKNKVFKVGS